MAFFVLALVYHIYIYIFFFFFCSVSLHTEMYSYYAHRSLLSNPDITVAWLLGPCIQRGRLLSLKRLVDKAIYRALGL